MSKSQDTDLNLDLEFLPAWAQQSPAVNRYANYQGGGEREDRRDDRRDRGPRRDQRPPPRRDQPQGQNRGQPGQGRPQRNDRQDGPRRGDRQGQAVERVPLPEIQVAFTADDKGVDSLARQIRMTGRAYPLFQIAAMVLAKPERHSLTFSVAKNAEGQAKQPMFVCALDDSLWLSENEAVDHVLNKHFATFYQAERTATEPPKGVYTFVAQCGMSGVILGPPNYHDYQNQLRKLHSDRFARMPFDAFKARVKIVRDEVVVKKWIEDQSWKTEFNCLNVPEPTRLGTREEVGKHFRETHLSNIIKQVDSYNITGAAGRNLRCRELIRLLRTVWEDQRRFPLQMATTLSQQFASRGLQFFKVNKTVTHVSVARPQHLDLEATPVSDSVKRIVEYIQAKPKCTHMQLIEGLAPSPKPAQTVEGAAAAPAQTEATPEQTVVIADLHWLIHQGHVIEFANGVLELAKKPLVRPPKPAPTPGKTPQPGAAPAPAPGAESSTDTTTISSTDACDVSTACELSPPPDVAATETPPGNPEPMTGASDTGNSLAPHAS